MRNLGAVLIAAVMAYVAILVIIAVYAWLAVRIGPIGTSKVTLTVQMSVENASMFFIACAPAGMIAALVARPAWRRKAAVIGVAVAWTVCFIQGLQVWFGDVPFALPPGFWVMVISQQIAGLLGAIAGGLVGAILYEKMQAKWGRQVGATIP